MCTSWKISPYILIIYTSFWHLIRFFLNINHNHFSQIYPFCTFLFTCTTFLYIYIYTALYLPVHLYYILVHLHIYSSVPYCSPVLHSCTSTYIQPFRKIWQLKCGQCCISTQFQAQHCTCMYSKYWHLFTTVFCWRNILCKLVLLLLTIIPLKRKVAQGCNRLPRYKSMC
jgi:hypothetical protein